MSTNNVPEKRGRKKGPRTNNHRKLTKYVKKTDAVKDQSKEETLGKESMGRVPKYGADNDPNWYFTDAMLAEQASQLSFQSFIGSGTIIDQAEVPSIMVLYMNPSPGVSYCDYDGAAGTVDHVRDGLNLMETKIYTLLSSYSGRTSSYAPQDVGTMILALGEAITMIEYVRRVFGIANTYNARNRTYPAEVIRAMGIDSDDLFDKMADYRMKVNTLITMLNQIPLLDNIGYLRKCRDIYQKIYLDDPSSMAQSYIMVPFSTWIIDETSYSGGTILKTVSVTSGATIRTMQDILSNVLEPMVDALLTSSTLQVVYADLINLANKASYPTFTMDYIDEKYVVIPEYNRYALLQIHNLNAIGAPVATTFTSFGSGTYVTPGNDVYPDPNINALVFNPGFANVSIHRYYGSHMVVDMDTDAPDLTDRIECLRFKSSWLSETYTPSGGSPLLVSCTLPDHYCVYFAIYTNVVTSTSQKFTQDADWIATSRSVKDAAIMSAFHMAPMLPVAASVSAAATAVLGELHYYTSIDFAYLSRLNRLMYTGLFDFRM